MSHFDWPALQRTALRNLRLRPAEFWGLTPAEFRLMMGIDAGQAPMGRAALDALAAAYPDQTEERRDD